MIEQLLLTTILLLRATSAADLTFLNNSPDKPVFVQMYGSGPHTLTTIIGASEQLTLGIPEPFRANIWGRIDCFSIDECNQLESVPVSTVEITIGDGFGYYDVVLIEGFNIPISSAAIGGNPDGGHYSCTKAACEYPILEECPDEFKVVNGDGVVISCRSPCNTSSEECSSVDFGGFFKEKCPDAFSFELNDDANLFTCDSHAYIIGFL